MSGRVAARLILAFFFAVSAGCAVNPVTGESELMLVSEEQELALGREAYPSLKWQEGGPLQLDPVTTAYLAGIVGNLRAVSHRPHLPVDFTLQSASIPNAWAIPGHTAVNRGLLQALESEAQFAFVMGHELGHVAARHTAKRQTYALLGGALLGLGELGVGARDGGALGELALGAAAIGTGLVLLKYDRGQELEADRLGVLYMARAGYDPREAVRAHEALNRAIDQYLANIGKRREEPGPWAELLSTHPRHEARVGELQRFIQELPAADIRQQREGDGKFAGRWHQATAAIRVLAPAYAHYDRARLAFSQNAASAAHREIGEALRLADQAQFSTLQGAIFLKERRFAEAREAFARALARYPGYQPALHGLGVTEYRQGRHPNSVPYLEESLRLRPGFLPSEYVLGLALVGAGRYEGAIPHLRAVAEGNPQHPEVHGILAQAYERTGNPRAAAAAWRAQLRAAPDSDLGREARRRLQTLSASAAEPYSNASVRVRLALPPLWEVERERSRGKGGEVLLRRAEPTVTLRIASTDLGAPQDLEARLDAEIRERLADARVTLIREHRGFRLGRRAGIAKQVEYRRGGVTIERLFATAARGDRVYWVDVAAERSAWRDPDVREEIQRLLDSLEF